MYKKERLYRLPDSPELKILLLKSEFDVCYCFWSRREAGIFGTCGLLR